MAYNDPIIMDPLNSMSNKLSELRNIFLSLNIIIDNLIAEVPFSAEKKRKVRRIIRGRFYARTQQKLRDMNKLDSEISGLFNFYESAGAKLSRRSMFQEAKNDWTVKEKENRRVYLSSIGVYLDYNIEGLIMKRLNEKKFEETTTEELKELKEKATGYLAIVESTKLSIKNVKEQYQATGIDRSIF